MARAVALAVAMLGAVAAALVAAQPAQYEVDLSQATTPFPHFWSHCVGSGHAALALRQDWRDALAQSKQALGWEYIRFHGILDDDMSVVLAPGQYSFFDIDSVYDFLRSIDMRPIVELSFMPGALASGNQTIFWYKGNITPPRDYAQWDDLITALATHLVQRYGIDEVAEWYFEVWNEPNCGFWSGTIPEYWTLLQHTYNALKAVSPRLRVGGPATCQSQYINETLAFCAANGIRLDFVSTHEYPTDPTNGNRRTLMHDVFAATRAAAQAAGNIPVIYTEFNSGLFGDTPNHDLPYAASFVTQMVAQTQGLVEMASYWTFSDIFEEGGFDATPFHDMYGMVANNGVPKPAYHAFHLLHRAGEERVAVTHGAYTNSTGVWAVRDDATLNVFITNTDYYDFFAVQNQTIVVSIPSIATNGVPSVTGYLIDDVHGNPRAAWEAMGAPAYPTQAQLDELQAAAVVQGDALPFSRVGNGVQFSVTLIPYATLAVFIPLQYTPQDMLARASADVKALAVAQAAEKAAAKAANTVSRTVGGALKQAREHTHAHTQYSEVDVVQSARDTADRLTPQLPLQFGPDFAAPVVVAIDDSVSYQQIFGFGGALTEAAAVTFSLLSEELQTEVLNAYYSASGHRYTVGRVPMNSCDFSVHTYSFDDVNNDFGLEQFDTNVTHDRETMIPLILRAQALVASSQPGAPTLRLFTTPWSPPAWLKGNGDMNGSSTPGLILDANHQAAWALYFSKFITAYANAGVNLWGLTVQNEPEYAARYEACVYSPAQERDFVANFLGPQLAADHPNVNIMIYDHNKDDIKQWADTIYSDPKAAQYVWGTAFHWYSGDGFDHLSAVHDAWPNKFLLASEACTCPPSSDWANGEAYGHDIIGDLNAWAVGWTDWNILLNPDGGPNHVQNYCNAPIIANTAPANQSLTYQPAYWYMGHFSRFLPPGSTRISTTVTGSADVQATTFVTPDGDTVTVLMNQSDEPIALKLYSSNTQQAVAVTLLAHSIQTLSY